MITGHSIKSASELAASVPAQVSPALGPSAGIGSCMPVTPMRVPVPTRISVLQGIWSHLIHCCLSKLRIVWAQVTFICTGRFELMLPTLELGFLLLSLPHPFSRGIHSSPYPLPSRELSSIIFRVVRVVSSSWDGIAKV